MAENSVPVDLLAGKDQLVLFGEGEASEHMRDFIHGALSPLGSFLEMVDDLAQNNDEARTTAATGKALLRQANALFDQLHEQLRQAGVGILVGVEGKSWEPRGVTSCAVKHLPIPDLKEYEEARQRWELRRTCAERMDALVKHPGLAEDMLAHMEMLVAKAKKISGAEAQA